MRLFHHLQKVGYKIYLYYIVLDSIALAKKRVAMRVKKGGHNIEPYLIEKRYTQSLQNLKKIAPLCEKIEIFDNSQSIQNAFVFKKINDLAYIDSLLA